MFEDLTLFSMAKKSMEWLSRRQEVLSQNVANANTPKYKAKDLAPLDFKSMMQDDDPAPVRAVVTNPMHISPPVEDSPFKEIVENKPEEAKPDGNEVLLEEQMQKVGEVKDAHQLAINLYQANMAMLKNAIDVSG
jgi:flagellar basal-body rod protein FlgB